MHCVASARSRIGFDSKLGPTETGSNTMTVLNTGSTKKYATGWENIFSRKSKSKPAETTAKKKTSSAKKPAAKKVHASKAASRKPKQK